MDTGSIVILISIIILAMIIIVPFVMKPNPAGTITDPRLLGDKDSQFLEIHGIRIHYQMRGSGAPALVLIHGFGSNLWTWQNISPIIGERMTVLAYDCIGFGLSSRPLKGSWKCVNPYSTLGQMDLLIALLDSLKIDKAVLVGHSAGAIIAAEAALAYREKFIGLILVDPMLKGKQFSPLLRRIIDSRWMNGLGPLIVRSIASSGNQAIQSAWHDPSRIPPETFASYRMPLQIKGWDLGLWEYVKTEKTNVLAKVSQFKLPVMIISGSDDRIVPTRNSIELYRWIPGAEVKVIPNSGHVPQEEQPEQFAHIVSAFISKIMR